MITADGAGKVAGATDAPPLATVEGAAVAPAPGVSDAAGDAEAEAPGTLGMGEVEPEGAADGSGVAPQLAMRLPITKRATTAARTMSPTPTSGRPDIDCMEGRSV